MAFADSDTKLYSSVVPFVNVVCKTVTSVSVVAYVSALKLHGNS